MLSYASIYSIAVM